MTAQLPTILSISSVVLGVAIIWYGLVLETQNYQTLEPEYDEDGVFSTTELVNKTVAVKASPTDVFRQLDDLQTFTEWYPGGTEVEPVDGQPMGLGKQFVMHTSYPLVGSFSVDLVVTAYEKMRRIALSDNSLLQLNYELVVGGYSPRNSPSTGDLAGYSTVQMRLSSRRSGPIFRYVFGPPLSFLYKNRIRQALLNFRFSLAR